MRTLTCQHENCANAAMFDVRYGIPYVDVENEIQLKGRAVYSDRENVCETHLAEICSAYVHVGIRLIGSSRPLIPKARFRRRREAPVQHAFDNNSLQP